MLSLYTQWKEIWFILLVDFVVIVSNCGVCLTAISSSFHKKLFRYGTQNNKIYRLDLCKKLSQFSIDLIP